MSPAPSLLDDHIKLNQAFKLALRRLSASTPASGDMGAVPGGTCLVNGMAISWKRMQQPSAAAIIDKNDTREHSGDLSASAKKTKTADGAAMKTKTADGAAVEDEARTPSAKASASAAADCLHAGIQQRLSQNNNLKIKTAARADNIATLRSQASAPSTPASAASARRPPVPRPHASASTRSTCRVCMQVLGFPQ